MRKWWCSLSLLALASAPARADVLVLTDGREIRGKVRTEGASVVVEGKHGEARFERELVARVKTDAQVAAEEAERKAQAEANRKAELGPSFDKESFAKLFGVPPPVLDAKDALAWVDDPALAARVARERDKLVLTFILVGERGKGRC